MVPHLILLQELVLTSAFQIALVAGQQLLLAVMLVQQDLQQTLLHQNAKLQLVQQVIIQQVMALVQLMDSYYLQ